MNVFLHLRSNAPPSGCRHLPPLRRGRVANRYVRSFPSPAEWGKVSEERKRVFFAQIAVKSFLR